MTPNYMKFRGLNLHMETEKNGTHGGVAMYVSNKFHFDRRIDLEENILECI